MPTPFFTALPPTPRLLVALFAAALLAAPRAAVGEIGLDRWIIDGVRPGDPRITDLRVVPLAEPSAVFAAPLDLAAELARPANVVVASEALAALRARPLEAPAPQVSTNFTRLCG
jgi:TatD DNase family protein